MPNLGGGGGERIISILLNNIDRKRFIPELVLLKRTGSNDFLSDLKDDIRIHRLDVNRPIKISFLWLVYKFLQLCYRENPDIVFTGSGQINALLSLFIKFLPKNTSTIARESNIPSVYEKYFFVKFLYKNFYNNYDQIIVQSDDMYNDLVDNFSIKTSKITKINNPVDFDFIKKKLESDEVIYKLEGNLKLLVAGRLTFQKGFDLLLKELSNIESVDYHLTILGDGEDRDSLMSLSKDLSIESRVSFLGNVDNPYAYMKLSDLFILSSRFEGFPNVVLESLSCGCPVLANNCLGGINEIIQEGINGEVFSYDKRNFSEKLNAAINNNYNREKVVIDTRNRYSIDCKMEEFHKVMSL